ncbi:MAG TPA: hypothetical protein EYP59_05015, partial [Thiotrichaceae bacterium]|nr:hypothetical protein [Thiotrichaceae bacterium]
LSSTLILPDDDSPLTDPYEIRQVLEHQLDLIIDGGFCGFEATTVIDFLYFIQSGNAISNMIPEAAC